MEVKEGQFIKHLCRYVSFQRFCEMLFFQQLTLVSPKSWNDKYENYVLNVLSRQNNDFSKRLVEATGFNEDQVIRVINLTTHICQNARCLCFSKSIDAEVMWNAYSYNNQAIMWKTTDIKLYEINDDFDPCEVKYDLEDLGIKGFMNMFTTYQGQTAIRNPRDFLGHKRKAFEYENELRIMDYNKDNIASSIKSFPIPSLSTFIDGVMVHPLASDDFTMLVQKICEHFNVKFDGKSQIYEMKEIY